MPSTAEGRSPWETATAKSHPSKKDRNDFLSFAVQFVVFVVVVVIVVTDKSLIIKESKFCASWSICMGTQPITIKIFLKSQDLTETLSRHL